MWITLFLKVVGRGQTLVISIDLTILENPSLNKYDHLLLCFTYIFRVKFVNELNVMCLIYYMYIQK